MTPAANPNRPRKGDKIFVEPIRDLEHIKAIKKVVDADSLMQVRRGKRLQRSATVHAAHVYALCCCPPPSADPSAAVRRALQLSRCCSPPPAFSSRPAPTKGATTTPRACQVL